MQNTFSPLTSGIENLGKHCHHKRLVFGAAHFFQCMKIPYQNIDSFFHLVFYAQYSLNLSPSPCQVLDRKTNMVSKIVKAIIHHLVEVCTENERAQNKEFYLNGVGKSKSKEKETVWKCFCITIHSELPFAFFILDIPRASQTVSASPKGDEN